MKRRIVSLIMAVIMVVGMFPVTVFATAGLPFDVTVDGEELKLNKIEDTWCKDNWVNDSGYAPSYKATTSGSKLSVAFKEGFYSYSAVIACDSEGKYIKVWNSTEEEGIVTIDLPVDADHLCIYNCDDSGDINEWYHLFLENEGGNEEEEDAPLFTVTVNGEKMTEISESTLNWESMYGGSSEVTCYTVTVPEDATEATLDFSEEKQWSYYDSKGNYVGDGETSWTPATSHTVEIKDSNGDKELDGISVQIPNAFSAEYFILFKYEEKKVENPFLSIKAGENEVSAENIEYKGIFKLGDYAADEQQGVGDTYDYVHEVSYYHVTVPCGTEYVDVTYSAETNIMNSGSNAYGYKTDIDLEVDLLASATVKSTTFKDGYTRNEDGIQTVKTPVKGYTFDAEGKGHAITLEEDGGSYAAVCLFSFEYDGVNHVYDNGKITTEPTCTEKGVKTFTCSCGDSYTEEVEAKGHSFDDGVCTSCGEADPDYVAQGGAVIPEDAPFTAITTDKGDASGIEYKDTVNYDSYENIPYYHVTIPAGATEVYVTHPSSEDPFADTSRNEAYGYYASTDWTTGGMMTFDTFEKVDGGYKITLPLKYSAMDWITYEEIELNFVADADGYVEYAIAVERNNFSPICFFTFEYGESTGEEEEHVHSYDEGEVTKEPTCTEKGVKTYTCSGCDEGTEGHSYTEDISATGHSYDEGKVTIKPTCNEAGIKTYECQNDGCTDKVEGHYKTEPISKTGHNYDEGKVTTEPTCKAEGVKTYTCQNEGCTEETEGHTKEEAIPVTGHNYGDDKVCDDCGFVDYSPEKDENGVYQIGTAQELLWFAKEVNGGNGSLKAALTADIDLAEIDEFWPGIGISGKEFKGSFDGQNHVVKLNNSIWGMFGYVEGKSSAYVQIENIITEGTVKNSAIVHNAKCVTVENCINKADVISESSQVAGILGTVATVYSGDNYGANIINCVNEGSISGNKYIGGILGYSQGRTTIDGCYNTGAISGNSDVGGIAGYIQGYKGTVEVKNSYNLGKVTGSSATAGIVGNLYNSAKIINCYNAGESAYAITGNIYNNTVTISNVYYRGDLCSYSVPNKTASVGYYTGNRGIAKSSAEMSTEEFAALLGDAFKQSCPSPVHVREEAHEHTIQNNICTTCKMGNNMPVEYKVTFIPATGSEIIGDTTFRKGNDYSFSVKILDGYYAAENFAVYVNGVKVEAENGIYTVQNPDGPFYISVEGVKKYEGILPISLPGTGAGYRVNPCDGYANTVESGKEYKFTVTFVDGFKAGKNFAVKANGEELTADANGIYTIENILINQVITVENVDIIPCEDTVEVKFDVTKGEKEFLEIEETGDIMMEHSLEIPYFDIELYDLAKYYYNPYCYVDEQGNIRGQQKVGNRETAYGVVTAMHAFIYFTEVYYLGYDIEDAGTGYSNTVDTDGDGKSDFKEAVSWTQGVGSSFMNLWGLGSNLNYHINYEYPIAYDGWGSTSDQQALKDGDRLSVHMITGAANGSAFGLFVVDDANGKYDRTDIKDVYTVKQGETFELTHYLADQGDNYTTAFKIGANKALYWAEEGNEVSDITEWSREGFGNMAAEDFVTDENGVVTIDTAGLEPGTYYIGVKGEFIKGSGQAGSDGFVSSGAESGPGYFKLIVEEGENTEEPEVVMGDVNGDGEINIRDANLVVSIFSGNYEYTAEEAKAADVNGDGEINIRDANLIVSYFSGSITEF